MSIVIQIIGDVAHGGWPRPAYVLEYRPELLAAYRGGHVSEDEANEYLHVTASLASAKRYPDLAEATAAWRHSIGRRWDGGEDRPLTAFHVALFDPEKASPA